MIVRHRRHRTVIGTIHHGNAEITKKLPEAEIAKESKLKTTEGAINFSAFDNFGIYGR